MSATVPLVARISTLSDLAIYWATVPRKIHLLQGTLTLTDSTTLTALMAQEATWGGYAPYSVASWGTPTDPSGIVASMISGAVFNPTGSSGTQNVWGWYMTDPPSSNLYLAEVFATPTVINNGQPYTPSIVYQLSYLYPP